MVTWNSTLVREDKRPPDRNLPTGHLWRHEKIIGSGGQGTAHLWAHLDNNENIVEQIVIKNFPIQGGHDILREGPGSGQLREAYIQQQLAPSGSTDDDIYTVPVLAAQHIPGSGDGWRTYAPYYSYATFEDILRQHTPNAPLPEPFLWFFFHRMAKAAEAMSEKLREPGKIDPVVVHNDIKPDNVSMGSPGSLGKDSNFVMYPPAYLGDFGIAHLAKATDKWGVWLLGCAGWTAPELELVDDLIEPSYTYTNIWQIGYIIYRSMTGNLDVGWQEAPPDFGLQPERFPAWRALVAAGELANYSDDLWNTVIACLPRVPKERISLQDLLARIETLMPKHIDGMDRWGTLSWIQNETNKADDGDSNDDSDGADGSSHTTGKRKRTFSGPHSETKRHKGKEGVKDDILQRRHILVAKQMKLGKTSTPLDAHPDDQNFILTDTYKLEYPQTDNAIETKRFLQGPEPRPLEFEVDLHAVERWEKELEELRKRAEAEEAARAAAEEVEYEEVPDYSAGHWGGDPMAGISSDRGSSSSRSSSSSEGLPRYKYPSPSRG